MLGLGVALVGLHALSVQGSTWARQSGDVAGPPPAVCEARTINYITHQLPQQCLRTARPASPPESTTSTDTISIASPTPTKTTTNEPQKAQNEHAAPRTDHQRQDVDGEEEEEDFATSSFMSFEEWKAMMLQKSGQDPANIKGRTHGEDHGEREPGASQGDIDGLGDDHEISIDFDALSEKVSELASPPTDKSASQASKVAKDELVRQDNGKKPNKDAGKTCKERYNYASFDGGATILKTSPDATNPKHILSENKDSYMLLECRTKNKFVIVELVDDILVDTVVLANFEFFSSMIRKFRVSVSDRYPVKLDKWVELGTYEARNVREIQAFLVEHPQIYTKYIRIEFLSHYGTEFYCPVSLLRVHGDRMIDSWKEAENSPEEPDQIEAAVQSQLPETNESENVATSESTPTNTTERDATTVEHMAEQGLSPWTPIHCVFAQKTCALRSPTTGEPTPVSSGVGQRHPVSNDTGAGIVTTAENAHQIPPSTKPTTPPSPASQGPPSAHSRPTGESPPSNAPESPQRDVPKDDSGVHGAPAHQGKPTSIRAESGHEQEVSLSSSAPSVKPTTNKPTAPTTTNGNNAPRVGNKTASSSHPSPTVQESFFKTVNKRLQSLESNTSLSMQYIEEQSRFLQEALRKMERKQIHRVDTFLDDLNKTVMAELRSVRAQYDQLWQSTVIALETQREQSQRETVALSSRLEVLANEIVFTKRMAVMESLLLLIFLVMLILSKYIAGGGNTNGIGLWNGGGATPEPHRQQCATRRQTSLASMPGFGSPPSPQEHGQHHTIQQNSRYSQSGNYLYSSPMSNTKPGMNYPRDKALPMTPKSEYVADSREGTPMAMSFPPPRIQVERVEEEDEEDEPEFLNGLNDDIASKEISTSPLVPISEASGTTEEEGSTLLKSRSEQTEEPILSSSPPFSPPTPNSSTDDEPGSDHSSATPSQEIFIPQQQQPNKQAAEVKSQGEGLQSEGPLSPQAQRKQSNSAKKRHRKKKSGPAISPSPSPSSSPGPHNHKRPQNADYDRRQNGGGTVSLPSSPTATRPSSSGSNRRSPLSQHSVSGGGGLSSGRNTLPALPEDSDNS